MPRRARAMARVSGSAAFVEGRTNFDTVLRCRGSLETLPPTWRPHLTVFAAAFLRPYLSRMDLDVTPFFPIVAAGVAVVGYGIAWWFQPKRRARRALENARTKRLGEVQEGERVGITGLARRLNQTLVSPVTGRTCLGYRFVIEERSEGWTTAVERSSCVSFGLMAEGVEATVEGPFLFGLDFDDRGDVWANLPPGLFR